MHRDVAPQAAPPSEVTHGRNLVCVIGIDDYPHWPLLHNARRDAERVRALFTERGFADAAPPLFDEHATRTAIESLVKDDLSQLSTDDSLVIFFAGHGHTIAHPYSRTGYIVPRDGAPADANKPSTWIDVKAWLADIAKLPPRHILVVLDSCHSGIALESVRLTRSSDRIPIASFDGVRRHLSRRVIASARGDQKASDSGPVDGHSLFASGFIDALSSPHGDAPQTGSELAGRVQKYVMRHERRQTPVSGTFDLDEAGEMVFAPMSGAALHAVTLPRPAPARRRRAAVAGALVIAVAAIAMSSAALRPTAVAPPDAGAAPIALLAAAADPIDAGSPPDAAPAAKPKTRRMAARVPAMSDGRDDDVFARVDTGDVAGVVARLVAGANVDAQGTFREKGSGATLRAPALGKAAYDCNLPMVEALIRYGASPRLGAAVVSGKKWTAGTTPLMFAAMRCEGRKGAALVRALLGAGAPIEQADDGGRTALHVVRDRIVADALLAAQARIEATAADGATPLVEAARAARKEIIRLLLEHGAKYGAKTAAGETAIWLASAAKLNRTTEAARGDVIDQLAFAGADVNAAPPGKPSALALAIGADALERAAILVRHGAHLDPLIDAIGAAAIRGDTARKRALCAVLPATQHARVGC